MYLFLATGSPIMARITFPIISFILFLAIITLFVVSIWYLFKKIDTYKKSEKYLEKERTRPTTYKDIKNFAKYYHLTPEQTKMLWEVCYITKCHNFAYLLKDINQVYDLFKKAFEMEFSVNTTPEKLNSFFGLLYKIENIASLDDTLKTTKALKIGSVVFYLNAKGEQFPFYVVKNTEDYFVLEIPEFLYNSEKRPKILERQRFIYKNSEGTDFNFCARVNRYEQSSITQCFMLVAHTDKIISTVQRHYRRQFIDKDVKFFAIKINENSKKDDDMYIYSNKEYSAHLSNISAGGCCINAQLPVKELQHIGLDLSELEISEKVVGIIRQTRRLPEGGFALHIQFIKISLESKNKLYMRIYGYDQLETLAN